MRWDNLFDDLEGQLEQELDAEQLELQAEEERLRLGRLSLRERIVAVAAGERASTDVTGTSAAIRMLLTSGASVSVRPTTFGKDWFAADLIGTSPAAQCIVPLAAIAFVSLTRAQVGESLQSQPTASGHRVVDRIGLAFVLRDLCRRRANLELTSAAGTVHGTIDRVGRDHLDLAVHEPGSSRRAANVVDLRMIPLETIMLVRI